METYIKDAVEHVLDLAREGATNELAEKYGRRWAAELAVKIDEKIEQAISPKDTPQ
jgi:hypothetical protein